MISQDGKNGRVRDEGSELKHLTFLATEIKTTHDATDPQLSPPSLLLEMSNGNKILPSYFQLLSGKRNPKNLFRSKPKKYSNKLWQCCQNIQRCLTVVGTSKQQA